MVLFASMSLSALSAFSPYAPPVPSALAWGASDEKQVLSIDDYALWKSIGSTGISDDGNWISFSYRQRDKDEQLHIVNLEDDREFGLPRGSGVNFSDDGRWAAYVLSPPEEKGKGSEDADEEEAPAHRQVQLLELESGDKLTWDKVSSFEFSKGSSYLYLKKSQADGDAEHKGADVILRNLAEGYEELLGSVSSIAFNKPGTVLAYTVDAADQDGNGVYALWLEDGRRRPLENGEGRYTRMTWAEEGDALAVLKGVEKKGFERRENVLLTFVGFERGAPERSEFVPADTFNFPKELVLSEGSGLSWNEGLTRVFFGLKEQEPEKDKQKKGDDKPANVDIWHWADERIQSVQMVRANRDRNFHWRGAYDLESGSFARLTDESLRSIDITRDGRWGVGRDEREYVSDWEQSRADYYRVDLGTGEREPMLTAHQRTMGMSPDSKHWLYWKDGHVWVFELDSLETRNLTESAPVDFTNAEYDHPGEAGPYGVAGWTEDHQAVVLRHRYDLWRQPLDGSPATNLTGGVGSEQEIRFSYVRLDFEQRFIDLSKPVLLSAYGQWTKKSGYYELKGGQLEQLIWADKRFGRVTKAEEADRYLYTIESFRDFPDYYVSDTGFNAPKRMTDANPQQLEYRWGHRILFDFENADGVRLQGTLAIPDSYVEGQKLPMLVNYYEKNSQSLHRYPAPRYSSGPQFAGYVSNGYLVMQPDIHFRTRTTHSDMLECVAAATQKVIEMGYVDPDRIAVHGHSFSGQGSTYIATHTDMFAAVVAGAAATNLVSDFNQLWKSAGTSQHGYDIYGQGRFGANPFDDFELYVEQSAVHHARDMNTPLLLLHGTDDGSVEWLQAVEFYNALRFNGKEVILLSYPGEGHGLRVFENQKDFQIRMRAFLDHHLKDESAPDWMTIGVPFLDKEG